MPSTGDRAPHLLLRGNMYTMEAQEWRYRLAVRAQKWEAGGGGGGGVGARHKVRRIVCGTKQVIMS